MNERNNTPRRFESEAAAAATLRLTQRQPETDPAKGHRPVNPVRPLTLSPELVKRIIDRLKKI